MACTRIACAPELSGAVETRGERPEHGCQHRRGADGDGDVAARRVARHEPARGRHERRDRVDVDERLQGARQRLGVDEHVARNVSGKMAMKPAFITAFGERRTARAS
jgi:hypothetical protein